MATEIRVPIATDAGVKLSVGRWFKRAGDPVSLDEPVVEINAGNVTHEVRAPVTGVLSSISVGDGESVEPGSVLGAIRQF
jgi:pyruvate/2-oxoglutarate dehydrogenase complex dihydrolipoamide acyltransferase (E2) component